MLKLRKATLAAVAVTGALFMSACSGGASNTEGSGASAETGGAELDHLTVASIDVGGTIPLLIGVDEGIFEKHGLEVETTMAPAFDGTLAAVMNGQADIGFAASPPMIRAMVKGAPIRTVAQTATIDEDETQANVLAADPNITGPADLAGRSVAVASLNDLASVGIRVAVAREGGDPDEVQFVEMPGPQRLPSLLENRVDTAIFIGAPGLIALQDERIHQVFQYTEALPSGSPLDVYFSQEGFIEENEDVLARFRSAMTEAAAFANENPDVVREYTRTLLSEVPDQLGVVDEMELTTYSTEIDPDALMELQDALVQYGGLEKTIPSEQYFSFENER